MNYYRLETNSQWTLYPNISLDDLPKFSGTEQSNMEYMREYYNAEQHWSNLPEIECSIIHQHGEDTHLIADDELSNIPTLNRDNLPDVLENKFYVFPIQTHGGKIIVSERLLEILKEDQYLTQQFFSNKLIIKFQGEKIPYYLIYFQRYLNKAWGRIGSFDDQRNLILNDNWDFFNGLGFKISEKLRDRIQEEKLDVTINSHKPSTYLKEIIPPSFVS